MTTELIERERCAKIADEFAAENFRMATDTIMVDPVLSKQRKGLSHLITSEDYKISEDEMNKGIIHSSMAHAAQNIAAAIRAPAPLAPEGGKD
ncbi:hypothetical protein FHS77_002680 [Paenochrobactrum gallinarii]|uniref:Uncharacterized protein n=1 Tax=Paenochrobactrum gallinarii TaxID=643673 RepID=A0A841M019_9HYPH|nr:hypothetical protein [Paenochrobactrum gallinarii]MBB6262112.1 hypothetical protein [Paenochrobactrum gallinarii]